MKGLVSKRTFCWIWDWPSSPIRTDQVCFSEYLLHFQRPSYPNGTSCQLGTKLGCRRFLIHPLFHFHQICFCLFGWEQSFTLSRVAVHHEDDGRIIIWMAYGHWIILVQKNSCSIWAAALFSLARRIQTPWFKNEIWSSCCQFKQFRR